MEVHRVGGDELARGVRPRVDPPDEGPVGLGHVRYPTIGRGLLRDAQPFFFRQPGVLMAHNGNVTNYRALRQSLLERSIHLLSQCDVEPVMCEFADALNLARRSQHTIDDAMQAKVTGANIQSNSGAPGGGIQVKLRGVSTINANGDPLYVIDGVIVSNVAIPNGISAVTLSTAGSNAARASSNWPFR